MKPDALTPNSLTASTLIPNTSIPSVVSVPFPAFTRAELGGTGGTIRQIAIKAGHIATRHHHDFEQFLFVVSGHARLECEVGAIPLEPGGALKLDAGAWHRAEFIADTVSLEFNLNHPPAA